MTTVEEKILKQVEFYFSDSNLPKDKFLKGELSKNDNWLNIEVLTTFGRMKALTTDVQQIADALKKSPELLEVSEDGLKVRRKTELPEEIDQSPSTIYIKGFSTSLDLDGVSAFLNESGIPHKCVRMRYYFDENKEKKFKGSAFVELESPEAAIEATKKVIEVDGTPLIIMLKSDYFLSKNPKIESKKRKADEIARAPFVPDLLLEVTNIYDACSREDLKEWATSVGASVSYIDFSRGLTEAILRFEPETGVKASEAATKLNEKAEELKVDDKVPSFSAITGETEETTWNEFEAARITRRADKFANSRSFKKRRS